MTSRLLLPASVAVLVVASAACLPSRDNPRDPVNRPDAVLVVYAGTSGGSNLGTRRTIFTLDASGSSDRRERSLRFAFDRDDQDDFELDLDDLAACSSPIVVEDLPCADSCDPDSEEVNCVRTLLEIAPGAIPGGVGGFERLVRVRVRAGNDADDDQAKAVVTNRSPEPLLPADVFVPELTGGEVQLDACGGVLDCSPDPDGDGITWQWEQVRGDDVSLVDSATQRPRFTAPLVEQTLLFRVTADDGLASSSALTRVNVTTQVWVTTIQPTRIFRVYPDFRRAVGIDESVFGPAVDGSCVEDPLSIVRTTGASMAHGGIDASADSKDMLVSWTRASICTNPGCGCPDVFSFERDGHVERVEISEGGVSRTTEWVITSSVATTIPSVAWAGAGEGCAAVWAYQPFERGFAWLESDGQVVSEVLPGAASQEEEPRFVLRAPGGECWALSTGYDRERTDVANPPIAEIYPLGPAGLGVPLGGDGLGRIEAAASSPDLGVWVAGDDDESIPGACAGTRLARVEPDGGVVRGACIENVVVDALAPHFDGGLLAHDAISLRLMHIGTGAFLAEQSLDSAPLFTDAPLIGLPDRASGIYEPPAEPRLAVDPLERHVYLVDENQGRLAKIAEDAGSYASAEYFSPSSVTTDQALSSFRAVTLSAPVGKALASVSAIGVDEPGVAFLPAHGRRVHEVFVSSDYASLAIERRTGDIWLADGGASSMTVRRYDPFGRLLRAVPLDSPAYSLDTQPDGGVIVALGDTSPSSGDIVRLSVDGVPLASQEVAEPVFVLRGGDSESVVCGATIGEFASATLLRAPPDLASLESASDSASTFTEVATSRADDGDCWFSFRGRYDGMLDQIVESGIQILREGELTPVEIVQTIPGPFDVDPQERRAWVIAATQNTGAVITFDRDGTPGTDGFVLPLQFNAIDVQRRTPDTLDVWIVRGQFAERYSPDGTLRDSYFLGEIGSIFDLDVLP